MGYKKDDKCIAKAFDDERLFVLMGRDFAAPKSIIHWIGNSLGSQPPAKLHEALDAAIEMKNQCEEMNDRKAMLKRTSAQTASGPSRYASLGGMMDGTKAEPERANLGLATTNDLIQEIAARALVIGWGNYKTVDDK